MFYLMNGVNDRPDDTMGGHFLLAFLKQFTISVFYVALISAKQAVHSPLGGSF